MSLKGNTPEQVIDVFETNLGLGANELAYVVHYKNNEYICIDITLHSDRRFRNPYIMGDSESFTDAEIKTFIKSNYNLKSSPLWKTAFVDWLINSLKK